MLEGIIAFLRLFSVLLLGIGLPTILLLLLLGTIIKSAWIRVPVALFIMAAIVNSLPSPHVSIPEWRLVEADQEDALRRIWLAWISYKTDQETNGDWEHAIPKRLSRLFPDYLASEDARLFFNTRERGSFADLCKKAAADPTEVDRNGRFDYFAGKTGWMLAASKTPIEARPSRQAPNQNLKRYRVILEVNGSAAIWPEEEYQRRLQVGKTDFTGDR